MQALSTANTEFALDLFKHVYKGQDVTNVLFSPWSILSAMATLYLGAKGNTADQIAKVLHFNKAGGTRNASTSTSPRVYSRMEALLSNPCICLKEVFYQNKCLMYVQPDASNNIHAGFRAMSLEINQPTKNYLLKSVSQLYGEKSSPFSKEYLQSFRKYYNSEPQAVNFQEAEEQVRREINSWVEGQTEGKIQNLLAEGSVDSLTKLVLVNTLYFKGTWAKKFNKGYTKERPFRLSKNTKKAVQMMFQKEKFNWNYIKTVQTHILELPYVSNDLSLFILLPDDISDDTTGLEMLERELTSEKLSQWTSSDAMEETEVEVHLPRIKLEGSYDLKTTLNSMGVRDAFSQDRADFTGMSEKNNLVLSHVFHKTFVGVNEDGTEAGAASTGVVTSRSGVSVMFAADHPFLFFIRHNKTNNILFFGRFCSP